jgi:hypothetical protein
VAGLEGYFLLESTLRLMEGVAGQEDYCSEDLLLRVVVWKGKVTRMEMTVGWNVKPSPRQAELPLCPSISLQVS